jgi:polyphosphate kinase
MTHDRFINRELSWLDFNERVLALARVPSAPLLERIKFCAIFSGNLDEFFEVRVAALKGQADAGIERPSADGLTPSEQLTAIADGVRRLTLEQSTVLHDVLLPALAEAGIEIVPFADLDEPTRKNMRAVFDEGIFPVLTPLAVDPGHPFPYISNKSLNLAAILRDPTTGEQRFARVKVPPLLPRFVSTGHGHRLVMLEDLIAAELGALFPGMEIVGTHPFRVTRNADISTSDSEAEDLLSAVETELRRRRFGRAVRLEVVEGTPQAVIDLLTDELELDDDDVTKTVGMLDLTALWALHRIPRSDLKDTVWTPVTQEPFVGVGDEPVDVFAAIREQDILVHQPFDSFATSVEEFVRQAAHDPAVLTIKMTLYRTSRDSPIARALIEAAERGKQVAVLIELQARFDEQANIAWARALEEVGVHVAYGVVGLKTHTKVTLVVRAEEQGLRRYCHISTGNYNSSTAKLYEDLSLFTADPSFGSDLTKLFNSLTGFGSADQYERLVVAPQTLRSRIGELIRGEYPTETRPAGRVIMKLNSLADDGIVAELYAASRAGVQIDLIVRGICCLLPGVPAMSENIRVRSILGRYLEHSRVYHFANGDGAGRPLWMIGSADMMTRNLDRRVEALVPVLQPDLIAELSNLIDTQLGPDVMHWELNADGRWIGSPESVVIDSQHEMYERARRRARSHAV